MGDIMLFRNVKNYLVNKSFNINIFDNGIYLTDYVLVDCISDTLLVVRFDSFILKIYGKDFSVSRMLDDEVLFNGKIEKVNFEYI